MKRTTLLWAAGLLAISACKATPTLDGVPLTCTRDDTCPTGMRCLRGGCVQNSPPQLQPLGLRFVTPGSVFSITPEVTDAENDPVTLSWTQLYDHDLLAEEPFVGDTLTVTPVDRGTFAFEVVADDGDHTATAYLTLVAMESPPPDGSVYVSDTASDDEGCGTAGAPCATLAAGLAQGGTVVLAANRRTAAYEECLSFAAAGSVWGGFEPETWRYDPVLIGRTEILCTSTTLEDDDEDLAAGGHLLSGTSVVGHVSLRHVLDLDAGTEWPAKYFATVTFAGAARLWGADVRAPAVPVPAIAAGLLSVATDGHLVGVEISGDDAALDPPSYWLGIATTGGELEIAGLQGRGRVVLNEPVLVSAVGIQNTLGVVGIDGMEIQGGVAAVQAGLVSIGGDTTINSSTIDMQSFGTFSIHGIISSAWCDETTCVNPALRATANTVRIQAGAQLLIATCIGVGINHEAVAAAPPQASSIEGNVVELHGDIGLLTGVLATGGATNLDRNEITVTESAISQLGCANWVAEEYPGSPISLGAIGAIFAGGAASAGEVVSDNVITVGPRPDETIGFFGRNLDGVTITDNQVTMAVPVGPRVERHRPSIGFELHNETPGLSPSDLARNDVWIGDGAGQGMAVWLRSKVRWRLINNYLYGGDTRYNVGLRIEPGAQSPEWPQVLHNTVFGGAGLVSAAVLIGREVKLGGSSDIGNPEGPVGVFLNNLLDAGDGSERRFVLDNRQQSAQPLGDAVANVAVVAGSARPAPRVAAALVTGDLLDAGALTGRVHLALAGSGTFATAELLKPTSSVVISGESWVPAGPFDAVWLGNTDLTTAGPLAILGAPGQLTIGRLGQQTFGDFVTYLITDDAPEPNPLSPTAIAFGEAVGGPPLDVVFTANGNLWLGAGAGAAGQTVASLERALDDSDEPLTFSDPRFIEVTWVEPDLTDTDRFYIVDTPESAPRLVVWPDYNNATTIDNGLPDVVTSFTAGPVRATAGVYGTVTNLVAVVGFAPDRVPQVLEHRAWVTTAPAGSLTPIEVPLPAAACGGEFVTTAEILNSGCNVAGWCSDLWIGCANGRVEAYSLEDSSGWRFVDAPLIEHDAAVPYPVASLSAHNDYVVVGYIDRPEVTLLPPTSPSGIQPDALTFTLVGDVGARSAPEHMYGADMAPGITAGACGLALREPSPPADTHALSRVGSDDCSDAGTALDGAPDPYPEISVTQDIDGDARDVAQPDIGADERL